MKSQTQIDKPSGGHADGCEVVGYCALPSVILANYTAGNLGDITGAGKGRGAARRARACGVGEDPEVARAARVAGEVERGGRIVEHDLGRAILEFVGGRMFARGAGCRLRGGGLASSLARWRWNIWTCPSDTSIEEAAAAGAAAIVKAFPAIKAADIPPSLKPDDRKSPVRAAIWQCARRAIKRQFRLDFAHGKTGWHSDGAGSIGIDTVEGEIGTQRASLEAWARGETIVESWKEGGAPVETAMVADPVARKALCWRIWRALVPAPLVAKSDDAIARRSTHRPQRYRRTIAGQRRRRQREV